MIHDDEIDTSASVVRELIAEQLPRLVGHVVTELSNSGTDHAMWRVRRDERPDLVIRLPRRAVAIDVVRTEALRLEQLATTPLADLVATPSVHHVGAPTERYPSAWSVLEWIDGDDAWTVRDRLDPDDPFFATRLAALVATIRELDGVDAPSREMGMRGGPIAGVVTRIDRWLATDGAGDHVDLTTIERIARLGGELDDATANDSFVHGDLIAGNVLVHDGRVSAIIDWGGAGRGDPAQDLAPAWSLLGPHGHALFRAELSDDDATWARGIVTEVEHALGAVLYYEPRGHLLGAVMRRTLDQLLADAAAW